MPRRHAAPERHVRALDIRSGDTVVVIAGSERGKRGVVERTLSAEQRIVVNGVNIRKRHQRAGARRGGTAAMQGGVIDFPAPLHYSNVQLICLNCDQPTRLGRRLEGDHFVAYCKRCDKTYLRPPRA
ncbi:MAG: 50S ribosomal protein L24 [Candidatus Dormibacteria bacterium]